MSAKTRTGRRRRPVLILIAHNTALWAPALSPSCRNAEGEPTSGIAQIVFLEKSVEHVASSQSPMSTPMAVAGLDEFAMNE